MQDGFADQRESTDTNEGRADLARLLFFCVWDSAERSGATQDLTIEERFIALIARDGAEVLTSFPSMLWASGMTRAVRGELQGGEVIWGRG